MASDAPDTRNRLALFEADIAEVAKRLVAAMPSDYSDGWPAVCRKLVQAGQTIHHLQLVIRRKDRKIRAMRERAEQAEAEVEELRERDIESKKRAEARRQELKRTRKGFRACEKRLEEAEAEVERLREDAERFRALNAPDAEWWRGEFRGEAQHEWYDQEGFGMWRQAGSLAEVADALRAEPGGEKTDGE